MLKLVKQLLGNLALSQKCKGSVSITYIMVFRHKQEGQNTPLYYMICLLNYTCASCFARLKIGSQKFSACKYAPQYKTINAHASAYMWLATSILMQATHKYTQSIVSLSFFCTYSLLLWLRQHWAPLYICLHAREDRLTLQPCFRQHWYIGHLCTYVYMLERISLPCCPASGNIGTLGTSVHMSTCLRR